MSSRLESDVNKLKTSCEALVSSFGISISSINHFMDTLNGSFTLQQSEALDKQRLEIFAATRQYGENIHPQIVELIESLQGTLGTISYMDPVINSTLFPEVIQEVQSVSDNDWKLKAILSDALDRAEAMANRFRAEMVSTAHQIQATPSNFEGCANTSTNPSSPESVNAYYTPGALVHMIYQLLSKGAKAVHQMKSFDLLKRLPLNDHQRQSVAESGLCDLGVLQRAACDLQAAVKSQDDLIDNVCNFLTPLRTSLVLRQRQSETQKEADANLQSSWTGMKLIVDLVSDQCTKFAVARVDPEPIMYSIERKIRKDSKRGFQVVGSTQVEDNQRGRYEMPAT